MGADTNDKTPQDATNHSDGSLSGLNYQSLNDVEELEFSAEYLNSGSGESE